MRYLAFFRMNWWRLAGVIALSTLSCQATPVETDPLGVLVDQTSSASNLRKAMTSLDASLLDEAYIKALHRMIWYPGYAQGSRIEAFERLEEREPDRLKRTIRQQLPRMTEWGWLTTLTGMIAERGWTDLSPALVSSWARPTVVVADDLKRPEYLALSRMYGADQVVNVVYEMFLNSSRVSEQGLRTRCWALLHRLGERERLVALLAAADAPGSDAMLLDLRAGARDLGVVPYNREEILWLRKIRTPEHAAFWSEATAATGRLSTQRRAHLAMRDIPVVVAAARHRPDLLRATNEELYERLRERLKGQKHYQHGSDYDNLSSSSGRLADQRERLTWGDLAAMVILLEALDVAQVRAHLFDYAARDRADTTTEYGGVISLDAQGRFEVMEFPPVIRHHDNKFLASQAMFDKAYTSLFQFHYHAQGVRNTAYAGPGFGDVTFADNTRANCVVMTPVGEGRMNVDFYRHDRVLVDLGVIELP